MSSVRIWALESDYDRDAIQCLADKLVKHLGRKTQVHSSGRSAFTNIARYPDGMQNAVSNYLKQDQCVIFVIDADSPASQAIRIQQPNSLLNRIRAVLQQAEFADRVHLVMAQQELEAWLLIDCLGVAGYFAREAYRLSPENCHSKLDAKPKIKKLAKKRQAGDTSKFVEAFPGGRSAKEELADFSREVLKLINPRLKPSDLNEKGYREAHSPEVGRFVAVTSETLQRSSSLRKLGELVARCG